MMMKRQDNQETSSSLTCPTYQDTVTPPSHVTSTAMIPEFVYKNTVASNTVFPNLLMYKKSENDTVDHELRSKLSELVYEISKEELASSDDEPAQKVIDWRCNGEREKENDRVIQRERKNDSQKESNCKIEIVRNKLKMERLSKRWIEIQICREYEESDVVRQRHRERDQNREGSNELERQMEKHQEWDGQENIARQNQGKRNWHIRHVKTESENERKPEKVMSVETKTHTRANGLSEHKRDLQESKTQQVKIITEKAKNCGVDTKKRVKEHCERRHYLNEEKVNRGLPQRSNTEKDFEKVTEAHSNSAPSDKEEQMSPTEVSKKKISSESVTSVPFHLLSLPPPKFFLMTHFSLFTFIC